MLFLILFFILNNLQCVTVVQVAYTLHYIMVESHSRFKITLLFHQIIIFLSYGSVSVLIISLHFFLVVIVVVVVVVVVVCFCFFVCLFVCFVLFCFCCCAKRSTMKLNELGRLIRRRKIKRRR